MNDRLLFSRIPQLASKHAQTSPNRTRLRSADPRVVEQTRTEQFPRAAHAEDVAAGLWTGWKGLRCPARLPNWKECRTALLQFNPDRPVTEPTRVICRDCRNVYEVSYQPGEEPAVVLVRCRVHA